MLPNRKNRILQVGHLERFNPAVLALKDIIANPMFIEAHRLSIFKDRSTDVSVVLDLMIHDIDIILNIVNSEIQSIHAAGVPVICEHADIANVRLQFEQWLCRQRHCQQDFNQKSEKNKNIPEGCLCFGGFCHA